jgi:pyruvate/2-oxoglutarate dehydrogenase complex dihydrolipoamide acyltransferase (E2) component
MVDATAGDQRERLVVPDLGLEDVPLAVSLWLVPVGASVSAGDRVVELVAGSVTIDLEAPVSGRLVTWLVEEDEAVTAGTVLAEFEVAD